MALNSLIKLNLYFNFMLQISVWYFYFYLPFQNAFAENCRDLIKSVLNDKTVEDHDFVLFLHKVVKIDAEIESVNGDDNNKDR